MDTKRLARLVERALRHDYGLTPERFKAWVVANGRPDLTKAQASLRQWADLFPHLRAPKEDTRDGR